MGHTEQYVRGFAFYYPGIDGAWQSVDSNVVSPLVTTFDKKGLV